MPTVTIAPRGDIDLWAPVARDALPKALVDAMEQREGVTVHAQLATVMDGITTDGIYRRALLQLALHLPVGIDPVFDSFGRSVHRRRRLGRTSNRDIAERLNLRQHTVAAIWRMPARNLARQIAPKPL